MSILVFSLSSFLTVVQHIKSPLNQTAGYEPLEIGFPFQYYHEFMVDCPSLNYGWDSKNLILDIIITVTFVGGILLIRKYLKDNNEDVKFDI